MFTCLDVLSIIRIKQLVRISQIKIKLENDFKSPMINEISINSSNTIELSRSELLSWLNDLLGANVTKIEQLGTGAVYCQLLDLLYPGKVQLAKVNTKAKN